MPIVHLESFQTLLHLHAIQKISLDLKNIDFRLGKATFNGTETLAEGTWFFLKVSNYFPV